MDDGGKVDGGGLGPVVGEVVGAGLAGVASWTLLEYVIHRVLGHEMRGRGLASKEHLAHHADVTYFTPARLKALSAGTTAVVALPLATAVAGRRRALAFTAGLVTMYLGYEVLHRRTHTHPPRGRYGRWARRNHLAHHARDPRRNFGVSTPLWDALLRSSAAPPTVIRLPRRIAPDWMLDDAGGVLPAYAADYTVVGPRDAGRDVQEADRLAAFANRAPALDG